MLRLAHHLNVALQTVERAFPMMFPRQFPPGKLSIQLPQSNLTIHSHSGFAPALSGFELDGQSQSQRSMLDTLKEHILWAVPKHRRTIERRLKRKYGSPGLHMKILLPKTNLRVCNQCGSDHEVGVLCRKS